MLFLLNTKQKTATQNSELDLLRSCFNSFFFRVIHIHANLQLLAKRYAATPTQEILQKLVESVIEYAAASNTATPIVF